MATVCNVKLDIKRVSGSRTVTVTVTHDLCFSKCEILDGTTFVEKVALCGDDPVFDDNLAVLARHLCVKASAACVKRKITRKIPSSTLNEDWGRDEVYAQITLTPFKARKAKGRSNIVTGNF